MRVACLPGLSPTSHQRELDSPDNSIEIEVGQVKCFLKLLLVLFGQLPMYGYSILRHCGQNCIGRDLGR